MSEITYPSQNIFECGGFLFSSNFDNGNLSKVEKGDASNEFYLWTAPDNAGTALSRSDGTNAWFYFCISRVPKGTTLKLHVVNATNHTSLYKQDMRPVYKCNFTNKKWTRVRNPVKFSKGI